MESTSERNAIIAAIVLMVVGVIWMMIYTFANKNRSAVAPATQPGGVYDVNIVPPPEPPVVVPAPEIVPDPDEVPASAAR